MGLSVLLGRALRGARIFGLGAGWGRILRSGFALSLGLVAGPSLAQMGQGHAILTLGGECSPLGGMDVQVRGCAPEGTKVYLVADPDPGPYVHPMGTFSVATGENAIVRKGRIGPNGVAFFWLDDPTGDVPVGETLFWQAAFFDPTAPNGLSITNPVCLPVCPPGETFSCRGGVGVIEGLFVVGPFSEFPVEGTFRVESESASLAERSFRYEIPGASGIGEGGEGALVIQRMTLLDPCRDGSDEARVAIQFRLDASGMTDGVLPPTTTFSAEVGGQSTSVTLDTSCGSPIGVGLRTRPLILTCVESCPLLDFETQDDFSTDIVNGELVSAPLKFGEFVTISSASEHGVAAFDSNPGGENDPGRDNDLLVGKGNVLIVQENGTQTNPGVFDAPDDRAGGGEIRFDFARPVKPISIVLVDIDSNAQVDLVLTDTSGAVRSFDVPDHWTTDIQAEGGDGYGTLRLDTLEPQPGFDATAVATEEDGFDLTRVVSLVVDLSGSGAVDDLRFCPSKP